MTTPTQRSLKLLRDDGWKPEVVEHFNSFTKRRKDLFGFADILALKEGERPLLVQTTSGGEVARRIAKIRDAELYPLAAQSHDIVVHGWRKVKKKRGGKAMVWRCRMVAIE